MASELICDTCGQAVPPDTAVCPRDGTVVLASFDVSSRVEEPNVVVQSSEPPAAVPHKDPLIGLKLGEYELRSRIGVGGMGLVYEGIQPLIGKRVAVKVLRPELAHSTEQVERLLAEARAVNAIRHRGIIDIFGFGQVPDGRQYIIMEYLEGQALDAVLTEKNRLPVQEALALLDEVLAALAAAHGAGVVHRDLKPSNIFLVQQPDGSRYVKVLDFGLAKRGQGPTGRTAQTRTDMVVGTPEYMAPEQARGQEVGPMTDLYALGVVTFEIVTGRLPFVGSSPVDLLMKHVEARPPRPSEFVSDLPPALDAFILQMLTKDPETRPNSADALRQQLHKLRRTLRASTRSNPSAPAPGFEKSPAEAEADSRRPTTPVPVPPELSAELTSQELRAVGVRGPRRKHLPLVAALGFAGVLLIGAAAIIVRKADAPALVTPPAAPVTAAAQVAPAEAAAGPTPPAAEPATPAQVAVAPTPTEVQEPPVEDIPLQPLVATAPARAVGSTRARVERARSEVDSPVAPPRPMKASAPSLEDILESIDRLERRVDRLETSGKLDGPKANAARNLLAKYRDDARADTSAHARIDLLKKVTGVAGMIR
ncbi:serine/threonine-protein kinase [Myxococcus sp. Y35]|uniref:serine/threonine-protein kinase n=1 Tax=Pseudomyxococcus flavus TaxID=3115648 RepID=UPI003CEC592D